MPGLGKSIYDIAQRNTLDVFRIVADRLMRGDEPIAPCTALGPQARPALGLAGLFVEFANAHLFLDAAPLDQLPKTADRFLSRLSIS
jgi:hypothetical protein